MLTMTRASALSLVNGLSQRGKPPKSLLRTPRLLRVHRTPRISIARSVQVLSRPFSIGPPLLGHGKIAKTPGMRWVCGAW